MAAPRKRSVSIHGHRTSFSVEDAFFIELQRIANAAARPLGQLVAEIDEGRGPGENLSSAIRLYVLQDLQRRARPEEANRERL